MPLTLLLAWTNTKSTNPKTRIISFLLLHFSPISPPPFPEPPEGPSPSSAGTAAPGRGGFPESPPSDGASEAAEWPVAAPAEWDESGASPAAHLSGPPAAGGRFRVKRK